MSWQHAPRPRRPPSAARASPSRWMIRSTCARRRVLAQVDDEPERVDVRRVDRRQPRRVARLREQQPAVLLRAPSPSPTSRRRAIWPVMCGTLKRSRTIVTPARGTGSTRPRPVLADAEALGLELRHAGRRRVTWSNSGVSASYISACSSAPARRRHRPVLAGRDDVARGGGVVVGGGRAPRAATNAAAASAAILDMARHATVARCSPRWLPRPTLALTPNVEAAREYAATRPGTVAFAVRTEHALLGRRRGPRLPVAPAC